MKKINFLTPIILLFSFINCIDAQNSDSLAGIRNEFRKSPRKASFYSAVLPGLGQIYNNKSYKVPVIYAGAAVMVYYYDFNRRKYLEYKDNYLRKLANDPNNPVDPKFRYASDTRIRHYMEYWRRNRDYLILGMVALYLANIIDATVDAYLFDYDISQDLSLQVSPSLQPFNNTKYVGMQLKFRF